MRILAAIHPPEAARAEEDSSSNEPNPEYAGALES